MIFDTCPFNINAVKENKLTDWYAKYEHDINYDMTFRETS